MKSQAITFPSGATTEFHFSAGLSDLPEVAPPPQTIIITDANVAGLYRDQLQEYRAITFPSGEASKTLDTIAFLTKELIKAGANRNTLLIGMGGGVVTDIVGFLASVFMRGIRVAFVPTTLLAQIDAALGGKNGVNVGLYKNMLGTIRQPEFVLYDFSLLNTLPEAEWSNGFAEMIKYGYISDPRILSTLLSSDPLFLKHHPHQLQSLIEGCADVKNKIVHADETESGVRRILNFGHTAGHAFETLYKIPHGHAVGLGMRVAIRLSELQTGLSNDCGVQLKQLLEKTGLPTHISFDEEAVVDLLLADKKRQSTGIEYVLLQKPGVAITKMLSAGEIRPALGVVAM